MQITLRFEEMKEGVEFAKKYGAKVYVTTNIFAHNENIDGLEEYMLGLKRDRYTWDYCCRSTNY